MAQFTKRTIATAACAVILAGAGTAYADGMQRAGTEAGMGMATVFANLFYMPVKIGYATLGGLTGGLAYCVTGGSARTAERVWVSALGGDYVLNQDMVAGHQRIKFSGTADPDL
jgi:hypothetical protein